MRSVRSGRSVVVSPSPGARSSGGYVELHAHSAYSFLDGASLPEELAVRAAELGYEALALTDHDGVYGSLEFAHAAKAFGVRPITGAEVTLAGRVARDTARRVGDGLREPLPAAHRGARAHACPETSASRSRRRSPQALVDERNEGLVCLSGCARHGLAVRIRTRRRGSRRRSAATASSSSSSAPSSVATRAVTQRCASSPRRCASRPSPPATPMRTIRVGRRCRTPSSPSATARRSTAASPSGGVTARASCGRPPRAERFPHDRDAVERTGELAERLEFDLNQDLGYRYPDFSDSGEPAIAQLARVCDRLSRSATAPRTGTREARALASTRSWS